jgi:hypothetical protein
MPVDPGRIKGPVVIPNAIEVDLIWNLPSGKQVKNVLHGQVAAGFNATAAVAQAIFASITGSAAWTTYAAQLSNQTQLAAVQLRDLRAANFPYVASTGAAVAGTSATAALPPGVSLVVTERTASAGRAFRGRVYLPGLATVALVTATGAATAAANSAALGFMNQVSTSLTASGITLSIANPARQAYIGRATSPGAVGRSIPARAAAIVNVTTMVTRLTALTSQRRRSYVA